MPISNTKEIKSSQYGMTLLEVLIALVIIAGLMSFSLPRLRSGDKTKSVIRKITVLAKYVHSTARLKGLVYRIVIELGEGSSNSLYVERGASSEVNLKTNDEPTNPAASGSPAPPAPDFAVDAGILKEPMELPSGFKFDDIEFGSKEEKVTTGKAYIYFFPQGFATKAAIHISDGAAKKFTIVIHPLTGQSYAAQSYVALKDVQ